MLISLACQGVVRNGIGWDKIDKPGFAYRLRRGSLRSSLRCERSLVEAGGVEPPSENIPLRRLHTYPDNQFSSLGFLPGKAAQGLTCEIIRVTDSQV
ncbi:unnamed protein product, partial [marine sediment metagenome]